MKLLSLLFGASLVTTSLLAGPFEPAAGQPGSNAIAAGDVSIVGWATGIVDITRGPVDISDSGSVDASFGSAANALGPADATPIVATPVVSLGDGGSITLSFSNPITDGPGYDFAIFENGFSDTFLELAFVEVSSNGTDFFRFDAVSQTQTSVQVGGFDNLDPTDIDNLAGKYRAGWGTPFDLSELSGINPLLDVSAISQVRVIDTVGSINPAYRTLDSLGNTINDPWTTPFESSGFDLDAIGVINVIPEPSTWLMLALGLGCVCWNVWRK
ncbi:MAG: PEP-CTERM sorting domain-containing protein [Verrucomicrobiota bacterium]